MKTTARQRMLIHKLDQIIYRKKMSGRHGYYLGADDCTSTINGLIVKGLVAVNAGTKSLTVTDLGLRQD